MVRNIDIKSQKNIQNVIKSFRKCYRANIKGYRTHVKQKLHSLQGCFRKLNGREDV